MRRSHEQLFFSELLSPTTMESINDADTDNDDDDELNTVQDEENNNPQQQQQQQSIKQEIQPLKCSNPVVNRLSLLPAYPTFDRFGPINRDHLLLANIPSRNLTNEQRQRRTYHSFHQPFTLTDQSVHISVRSPFMKIYDTLYGDLTERFQIDNAILDYNYERLHTCMNIMVQERIRYGLLAMDTIGMEELRIVEHALAMEFYLQIDDELFFMKTCSFRNAQPSLYNHHGIFSIDEPKAVYGLEPCEQVTCRFCFPVKDVLIRGRQNQSVVQFSSAQKHRFVNGYEAILNCPTTCTRKNILYALTCPCGQYDYIGYTSLTLDEQLKYHREHGNRIMHEFILGSEKNTQIQQQTKSQEELIADTMLLYKHSIRCPSAIQLFLDCNPQYWHFVLMLKTEIQDSSTNNVPSMPSDNYTFSAHQRLKQVQLLKDKRECIKPSLHLDLYNATIIAVMPDGCTPLFYHLIEALFITHAQTKLNTLGHLDGMIVENNNSYDINARLVNVGQEYNWCQHLVRRPIILHEKTRTLKSHRMNPHFQ
ncbi:unnamed protein product [Adineta steineri]|uniref:Uncharacterized protein n=1 Tax=Adineta steineri TaxID=433720 RepID=A0A815PPE5_9BILA|nr:unnamed protein product [Adineta steineri]CAF1630736.1 unnamed protein product [Adineta steineri]